MPRFSLALSGRLRGPCVVVSFAMYDRLVKSAFLYKTTLLEQGAHPGSNVPGYRSSDLNGESKVLTPGGLALGSASPSAVGPTLGAVADSAVSPAIVAASADGPAETPTTGTGKVFPDRGPRDGCEDGFPGLLPSADVLGEQDGVGKDLLPEVRPFQDPPPVSPVVLSLPSSSFIRCSRFARDFLSGATSQRWISSPSFARANRRCVPQRERSTTHSFSPEEGPRHKSAIAGLQGLIPVLHQHVDHWCRGPGPITARALHRRDLLDLYDLFFLPAFGSPGRVLLAAQTGKARGGQGQTSRDRRFGAGICESRGLGLLGPQADFRGRRRRAGQNWKAPHST
nr:hypothetical protein Iba_chr01bCG5860 [Ipomoea batatas]